MNSTGYIGYGCLNSCNNLSDIDAASIPSLSIRMNGLDRLIAVFLRRSTKYPLRLPRSSLEHDQGISECRNNNATCGINHKKQGQLRNSAKSGLIGTDLPLEVDKYLKHTLPDLPRCRNSPKVTLRNKKIPVPVAPLRIVPRHSPPTQAERSSVADHSRENYASPVPDRHEAVDIGARQNSNIRKTTPYIERGYCCQEYIALNSPLSMLAALALTPTTSGRGAI